MLAVATPVFSSVVVGGLMLGLAAFAPSLAKPETTSQRLVLHAVSKTNEIYLSAWRNGPIDVELAKGELRPVTFRVRATLPDSCRWEGTETLVPIAGASYRYEYNDRLLGCPPGVQTRYVPTPRGGIVTVE